MTRKETRRLGMEHRALRPLEIRVVGDESKREVVARVVNYNVADTYGTVWRPGCFGDGLRARLPKIAWTHDWSEPIGRVVDFQDGDEGLDLTLKFSDFDAVPQARRAYVQIRDGDIDQFSIGFDRKEWIPVPEDEQAAYGDYIAWEYMQRAVIEEVSPVLVGSVPGTKPLAIRSALSPGLVERVAYLLEQGVVDKDEARKLLEDADAKPVIETEETQEATTTEEATAEGETSTDTPVVDEALLAELDEVLEIARSR